MLEMQNDCAAKEAKKADSIIVMFRVIDAQPNLETP
jgi:hypothetical protein